MGKLDTDPAIHHFSHQHPLELLNLQQQIPNPVSCSGCTLKASGLIYTCKSCNYFLHISCSKMPRQIHHPSDPKHMLTLFPSPVYPEGAFKCNACGRHGTGFCFHCKDCELDIHLLCALMPLSVNHRAHHHSLNLLFYTPYKNKGFSCDICKGSGLNHWLYRCDSCDFDAHLNCVVMDSPAQPNLKNHQQEEKFLSVPPKYAIHGFGSSNGNQKINQVNHRMIVPCYQPQFPHPETRILNGPQPLNITNRYASSLSLLGFPQLVQLPGMNRSGNGLMGQVVQGFVDGLAQQAGQAVIQGMLGGS